MTHLARTLSVLVTVSVLAAPLGHAQSAAPASESIDRITRDVAWLADDAREGRGVGTAGLEAAAAFIADAFREIGLEPGGTDGYFQPFELDPRSPVLAHTQLGGEPVKNIIGVLPGRGALAREALVIGAHYDHLGLGTRGYAQMSRDSAAANQIHNGADDNASGTAALLETARTLAIREAESHRTVIFVAFTAEELGTIGSSYYVEHPVSPHDSTLAMLNFDMVGRLSGDTLVVGGTGSATELEATLDRLNHHYGFHIGKQADPWGNSDHAVFYGKDVPVLHFYTSIHQDYHTPSDDWQLLNTAGIARIVSFAADVAWELATQPGDLTLLAFERPEPVRGGPRASLGTVPDMVTAGEGMRIQAVRAGTAADEAGLVAGDVILQIGDVEVKDIYGLQNALTTYKSGEAVVIVFLRDGERMETTATLN